jgi:hypothetical protein
MLSARSQTSMQSARSHSPVLSARSHSPVQGVTLPYNTQEKYSHFHVFCKERSQGV